YRSERPRGPTTPRLAWRFFASRGVSQTGSQGRHRLATPPPSPSSPLPLSSPPPAHPSRSLGVLGGWGRPWAGWGLGSGRGLARLGGSPRAPSRGEGAPLPGWPRGSRPGLGFGWARLGLWRWPELAWLGPWRWLRLREPTPRPWPWPGRARARRHPSRAWGLASGSRVAGWWRPRAWALALAGCWR